MDSVVFDFNTGRKSFQLDVELLKEIVRVATCFAEHFSINPKELKFSPRDGVEVTLRRENGIPVVRIGDA